MGEHNNNDQTTTNNRLLHLANICVKYLNENPLPENPNDNDLMKRLLILHPLYLIQSAKFAEEQYKTPVADRIQRFAKVLLEQKNNESAVFSNLSGSDLENKLNEISRLLSPNAEDNSNGGTEDELETIGQQAHTIIEENVNYKKQLGQLQRLFNDSKEDGTLSAELCDGFARHAHLSLIRESMKDHLEQTNKQQQLEIGQTAPASTGTFPSLHFNPFVQSNPLIATNPLLTSQNPFSSPGQFQQLPPLDNPFLASSSTASASSTASDSIPKLGSPRVTTSTHSKEPPILSPREQVGLSELMSTVRKELSNRTHRMPHKKHKSCPTPITPLTTGDGSTSQTASPTTPAAQNNNQLKHSHSVLALNTNLLPTNPFAASLEHGDFSATSPMQSPHQPQSENYSSNNADITTQRQSPPNSPASSLNPFDTLSTNPSSPAPPVVTSNISSLHSPSGEGEQPRADGRSPVPIREAVSSEDQKPPSEEDVFATLAKLMEPSAEESGINRLRRENDELKSKNQQLEQKKAELEASRDEFRSENAGSNYQIQQLTRTNTTLQDQSQKHEAEKVLWQAHSNGLKERNQSLEPENQRLKEANKRLEEQHQEDERKCQELQREHTEQEAQSSLRRKQLIEMHEKLMTAQLQLAGCSDTEIKACTDRCHCDEEKDGYLEETGNGIIQFNDAYKDQYALYHRQSQRRSQRYSQNPAFNNHPQPSSASRQDQQTLQLGAENQNEFAQKILDKHEKKKDKAIKKLEEYQSRISKSKYKILENNLLGLCNFKPGGFLKNNKGVVEFNENYEAFWKAIDNSITLIGQLENYWKAYSDFVTIDSNGDKRSNTGFSLFRNFHTKTGVDNAEYLMKQWQKKAISKIFAALLSNDSLLPEEISKIANETFEQLLDKDLFNRKGMNKGLGRHSWINYARLYKEELKQIDIKTDVEIAASDLQSDTNIDNAIGIGDYKNVKEVIVGCKTTAARLSR